MEFEKFKEAVKTSFTKVKEDILKQEQKIKELDLKNKELTLLMKEMLTEIKEIKNLINKKAPTQKQDKQTNRVASISAYDRILAILALGPVSTSHLKSIVVDKENLCSKATFYRYIKNLINKGKAVLVKEADSSVLMLSQNPSFVKKD